MASAWLAVCWGVPESVAVTVKFEVPAAVGVPDMAPDVLILNPAGKLPPVRLKLMAPVPPEAATVAL